MKIEFLYFSNPKRDNVDIEILDLSPRALNALKRGKIFTLGDLMEKWDVFPRFRNVGKNTIKEVRSALFNYNIENATDEQLERFIDQFRIIER